MKKSVTKRIKRTKTGKVRRRAMALGHNRNNKTKIQKLRKKSERPLSIKSKTLKRYL